MLREVAIVLLYYGRRNLLHDYVLPIHAVVLLNTLGSGSAYQALWTKLDKTLQQMK